MKITFHGFELTYITHDFYLDNYKLPHFYFEHDGQMMVLYHRNRHGWRMTAAQNRVNKEGYRSGEFYLYLMRRSNEEKIKSGHEMITYLVKESPMRLWLLYEFGPGFFDEYLPKETTEKHST